MSAESGATFRGDKSLLKGDISDPATLRVFSDEHARRDFFLGGILGTGAARKGRSLGGGGVGSFAGGLVGGAAEVPLTNFVIATVDANKLKK